MELSGGLCLASKTPAKPRQSFSKHPDVHPKKGTRMSNPSDTLRSLLHRLGVTGPVRLRASQGSGAPSVKGIAAPFLFVLIALCLIPGTAQAARGHTYSKSIAPTGLQALDEPSGVAIDEATGDVYVVDTGTGGNRVEYFNEQGAFQGEITGPNAIGSGTTNEPTATGEGTFNHPGFNGDNEITGVVTSSGAFEVGQVLTGDGLPPDTTITEVREETPTEETLVISSREHDSEGKFALSTGNVITNVMTETGAFTAGEEITGEGIPAGTRITDLLGGAAIEISNSIEKGKAGLSVPLKAELAFSFVGAFSGLETERSGIAVDNDPASPSFGDVYVDTTYEDAEDHRAGAVDKFTATGSYIDQFDFEGEGENRTLNGVAVDPDGDLWVNAENSAVTEFNDAQENELLTDTTCTVPGFGKSPGFAVDSNDDLYTLTYDGAVGKCSAAGTLLGENVALGLGSATGLASELSSDDLYVDNGDSVARIAPEGLVEESPLESIALIGKDGNGVGVNSASQTVYVAQSAADDVEVFTLEPAGPPTVERETVSDVTGESARFAAEVNPRSKPAENGQPAEPATEYYFQYTTEERFQREGFTGAASAPGGSLAASFEFDTVTPVNVQGLAPGTTYHYRVVASNQANHTVNVVDGEEHTFTTQLAGGFTLPDNRHWEMVSPPDKHGAAVMPLGGEATTEAAAAGGALAYAVRSPTESEPAGSTNAVSILGVRGADGWSSRGMTLPHEEVTPVGAEFFAFSEDLSQVIVQPKGEFVACRSAGGESQPCLSEEASEQTPFLRTNYLNGNRSEPCLPPAMHCYRPVVTGAAGYANVPVGTKFAEGRFAEGCLEEAKVLCTPKFRDASPDLQHVVFESGVSLTSPAGADLYEWSAGKPADEQLTPVSVLPPTAAEKQHGEDGQPTADGVVGNRNEDMRNAISADGSRVFWTAGEGSEPARLYMHDLATQKTLWVNEGVPVGSGESGQMHFQMANSEGSRVFFTQGGDLYECAIEEVAGELKCTTSDLGSGVLGTIAGVSEDGSWVYFVSNSVLAGGGVAGAPNLYVHHEGATSLVAVLTAADEPDWAGTGFAELKILSARVSPDGRWLTFMSKRSLTGYNNRDAVSDQPDEEVFLYKAGSSSHPPTLVCASCNPSGARPIGELGGKSLTGSGGVVLDSGWASSWLAAAIPGWNSPTSASDYDAYQPRYLSDSGRLFFDARDPLVAQAVNGNWDVYEYEPEGVPAGPHACGSGTSSGSSAFEPARAVTVENRSVEAGAGCVSLISSGESTQESAFLDADEGTGEGEHGAPGSEAGGEVFFMTAARLVPKDIDNAYDVYDAHECTSESPCAPVEAAQPPPCETEASCKAPPALEPEVFGSPASATFSGPGNPPPSVVPPPAKKVTKKTVTCKRGFVKNKKHECIRKKRRKQSKKAKKTNRRTSK